MASSRASTPSGTRSSAICHSRFALAGEPSTALAITSWRAGADTLASRVWISARTEGGNSSRLDSCRARVATSSPRRSEPEDSLGRQTWQQPLPLAQQLERLEQVERLSPRARKKDIAQRDQRPLRGRRGSDGGGQSHGVLLLYGKSLKQLQGLGLAERRQGKLAERQVTSQVEELSGKLWVQLQSFLAQRT